MTNFALSPSLPYLLAGVCFIAAALYAAVGHGGASAYLAVMGLFGMAPQEMKPIALTLNIAVSALAFVAFWRAGHFRSNLFWPLVTTSIPAAFVGGFLSSPDPVFKIILALALIFGAWRLAFRKQENQAANSRPKAYICALLGLGIGFISGLIGIGGGIFLTPLLIFFGWASPKNAAAISAAFICVNSIAGLAGFASKGGSLPNIAWFLLPAVLAGAWLGSRWGSRFASFPSLQRALALVLIIAAAKFAII
jgi:uncharacterized protein